MRKTVFGCTEAALSDGLFVFPMPE